VRELSELIGTLEPLRREDWHDIGELRSSVHAVTEPYRRKLACYGPLVVGDESILEVTTSAGETYKVTFRVPRQRSTW